MARFSMQISGLFFLVCAVGSLFAPFPAIGMLPTCGAFFVAFAVCGCADVLYGQLDKVLAELRKKPTKPAPDDGRIIRQLEAELAHSQAEAAENRAAREKYDAAVARQRAKSGGQTVPPVRRPPLP